MSRARVIQRADGSFELRDWPSRLASLLDLLAVLAGPEVPDGPERERLFPSPSDDAGVRDEWRRHVHPDLFALFAESRDVVAADLDASDRGKRGRLHRLEIPAAHVPAWIAALNTARLRLAASAGVDAGAMRAPPAELTDAMHAAVARIDFFGTLQAHLIEGVPFAGDPPPPTA